jgi:hypothetical protein
VSNKFKQKGLLFDRREVPLSFYLMFSEHKTRGQWEKMLYVRGLVLALVLFLSSFLLLSFDATRLGQCIHVTHSPTISIVTSSVSLQFIICRSQGCSNKFFSFCLCEVAGPWFSFFQLFHELDM